MTGSHEVRGSTPLSSTRSETWASGCGYRKPISVFGTGLTAWFHVKSRPRGFIQNAPDPADPCMMLRLHQHRAQAGEGLVTPLPPAASRSEKAAGRRWHAKFNPRPRTGGDGSNAKKIYVRRRGVFGFPREPCNLLIFNNKSRTDITATPRSIKRLFGRNGFSVSRKNRREWPQIPESRMVNYVYYRLICGVENHNRIFNSIKWRYAIGTSLRRV